MGLISWLADQREKVILGPARSSLGSDEEVLQWVRARQPGTKRHGFVFATENQIIVHWYGRGESEAFKWDDIHSWAINDEMTGGPVIAIENSRGSLAIQMPVQTHASADEVTEFVRRFARLAPTSPRVPQTAHDIHNGQWVSEPPPQVVKSRRTPREQTKRITVTVLGIVMVLGGMIITPLPGPWSLPVIIGGLVVLSNEYDWAKDTLQWVRKNFEEAKAKVAKRRRSRVS